MRKDPPSPFLLILLWVHATKQTCDPTIVSLSSKVFRAKVLELGQGSNSALESRFVRKALPGHSWNVYRVAETCVLASGV